MSLCPPWSCSLSRSTIANDISPPSSSMTVSSSSGGSVSSSARSSFIGTSYSSPRMGWPSPSAAGYRPGNWSRNEEKRELGAGSRPPTRGAPSGGGIQARDRARGEVDPVLGPPPPLPDQGRSLDRVMGGSPHHPIAVE